MDAKTSKNIRDLEEKILQNDRKSVLDLLEAKNTAANRKTILHRIIIVGKLRSFPDKSKLGGNFNDFAWTFSLDKIF